MLDRRDLFKLGAIGGAAALVKGCTPSQSEKRESPPATSGEARAFQLEDWTLAELQQAMGEGRLSAADLVEMYQGRIAEVDHSEAELRSILALNPDALKIAGQLDSERAAGQLRGPLHGIPVLLKDNIDTADKMATTAGSLALAGTIALQDSTVAKNLRAAGAVILGKTNLSEWANFRSERSSSGWSGVGGQTKNPYALDRNPCGSSSGSGAAVSANLAALAIGTETDGSVVCPSNANGIVGVKPTVGRVSRTGIVPMSKTKEHRPSQAAANTTRPAGGKAITTVESACSIRSIESGSVTSRTVGSNGHAQSCRTSFSNQRQASTASSVKSSQTDEGEPALTVTPDGISKYFQESPTS